MRRSLKFVVVLFVLIIGWIFFAPFLAQRLIVEKPLAKADAIIVLAGSSAYRERTQKAADIFKKGVAPKIFLTDDGERAGWSRNEKVNLPFVELAKRELVMQGVPEDRIEILPGEVTGTDWEAKVFAQELENKPIGSILIVTSAYHSRRALWTFEKVLAGKDIEIGLEHSTVGEQTPPAFSWWLSRRGWNVVAGEYVKSAVYWVYY